MVELEYIGNRLEIEEQCEVRIGSVPVKEPDFTTGDTEEILNLGRKSVSCECDQSCNAEYASRQARDRQRQLAGRLLVPQGAAIKSNN